QFLDVTAHAKHELLFGKLNRTATDFAIATLYGRCDIRDGEIVSAQLRWIDGDLVLFDEASDGSDLGNALDRRQLVAQVPILYRTQFSQIAVGRIDGIHESPPDTRGVWSERRRYARWQAATEAA